MKVTSIIREADFDVVDREKLASKSKLKPEPPRLWVVILHNNDYVSADMVAHILTHVFGHDMDTAFQLMLSAHKLGKSPVKMYPSKDIAETKINQAEQYAQQHGQGYGESEVPMFTVEAAD